MVSSVLLPTYTVSLYFADCDSFFSTWYLFRAGLLFTKDKRS